MKFALYFYYYGQHGRGAMEPPRVLIDRLALRGVEHDAGAVYPSAVWSVEYETTGGLQEFCHEFDVSEVNMQGGQLGINVLSALLAIVSSD